MRDLAWLGENLLGLRDQFGDQWIAVDGQQVVASGSTVAELEKAIERTDSKAPLVTFVGALEPPWLTTGGDYA